jgi:hypothetical protein
VVEKARDSTPKWYVSTDHTYFLLTRADIGLTTQTLRPHVDTARPLNPAPAPKVPPTQIAGPSKAATPPEPEKDEIISLSPEQQQVFDLIKDGKSVFFTG